MTATETWDSPLHHIELAVQERAKALDLDMADGDTSATLRALVDDEIERWHHEFQRGRRPRDVADPQAAAERALRNLIGYGPLEPLLADPDVWEIMVARLLTRRYTSTTCSEAFPTALSCPLLTASDRPFWHDSGTENRVDSSTPCA